MTEGHIFAAAATPNAGAASLKNGTSGKFCQCATALHIRG
jgi:hypothetical protein